MIMINTTKITKFVKTAFTKSAITKSAITKSSIAHMKVAHIYANLTHCNRRQVGCVIVKHDSIIAIGYNGTPVGDDNCCEDAQGMTKPTVIHAEDNALRKLTRQPASAEGSDVYVTTAPCILCAVRLVDAGVVNVFYDESSNSSVGIEYLRSKNVTVTQIKVKEENT